MTVVKDTEIPASRLRWRCDGSNLGFESTSDVHPATDVFGQETAREALLFGLQCVAPGQNVYVRGTRGTGRQLLVRRGASSQVPVTLPSHSVGNTMPRKNFACICIEPQATTVSGPVSHQASPG